MRAIIGVMLAVSGCASFSPSPPLPITVRIEQPFAVIPVSSPTSPPSSATTLINQAEKSKEEARRYVLWKESKPENIDKLAALVVALNDALTHMKKSHYDSKNATIVSTRLNDLQVFLKTKDD